MKRALWLAVYAMAATLAMLLTWLRDHAEKQLKAEPETPAT